MAFGNRLSDKCHLTYYVLEFEVLLGQPIKSLHWIFDQEICQVDRFNKVNGTDFVLVKGEFK